MITLFRANAISAIEELKRSMREHIKKLPQQISFVGTPQKIMRFELPCKKVNILGWLHNNQIDADKVYWSDRSGGFEMGGIGICDVIQGHHEADLQKIFEQIEDKLSIDNVNLRYYGGFRFDQQSDDPLWQELGNYRFIVPRFEFFHNDGNQMFAFNIAIADAQEEKIKEILKELDSINFDDATNYRKVPEVLRRKDTPDKNGWLEIFDNIFDDLKSRFQKIVLARKTDFTFDMDIRPMALLKHLKEMSPNCYHFCFQPHPHFGFLGASPERLFKQESDYIFTEALAGTAKRGATPREDEVIALGLLSSKKNIQEHKYVVDDIMEKLKTLCSEIKKDDAPSIVKLDNGQHLKTYFEGTLKNKFETYAILGLLHPTPAVAGCPKNEVLEAIRAIEPFGRGWYAAPVGFIGYDKSEFAVAIRSGLVNGNKLSLFAGAGIVEGSKEDEEWEEIEDKMSSFIKVFQR